MNKPEDKPEKLSTEESESRLAEVPEWKREGAAIQRTFEFKGFAQAVQFVQALVAPADAAAHHPDLDVRYNKVTVKLTTHDAGGLTAKDFLLAQVCDSAARETASR